MHARTQEHTYVCTHARTPTFVPMTTIRPADWRTRCSKDAHFQQVVLCAEGIYPCENKKKAYRARLRPKTDANVEFKLLFQCPASPSPIPGNTENATFADFTQSPMSLKTGFLSDYQVLFLLLNGPQIEKKVCSLIDRFMTSEGGVILILPFTSNTGANCSAKQTKDFFFYLRFTSTERSFYGILYA